MMSVVLPETQARHRFQDQATLAHACAALTLHPSLNLNGSLFNGPNGLFNGLFNGLRLP